MRRIKGHPHPPLCRGDLYLKGDEEIRHASPLEGRDRSENGPGEGEQKHFNVT